jgi:SAM-dependent methyltransferase
MSSQFDAVAAEYEAIRPGYPADLYERLIAFARLTPASNVLEVGAGTGKATVPLAQRDVRITVLEPGPGLARLARTNLAEFANVSVQTTTFEDWTVEAEAFDLAFCAQAYHWLEPEQRLDKFASALRADGVLAIFGNAHRWADDSLCAALDAVYAEHAPELAGRREALSWYADSEGPVGVELRSSRKFSGPRFETFDWQRSLCAVDYAALLATYSDHFALPAARLAALQAGVIDVIERRGGTASLNYRTGLFLARRVPGV